MDMGVVSIFLFSSANKCFFQNVKLSLRLGLHEETEHILYLKKNCCCSLETTYLPLKKKKKKH